MPLDSLRQKLVQQVCAHLSRDRLREVAASMTGVASPTGAEAPLAKWLHGHMREAGLESSVQFLDDLQANAVGRVRGDGTGADLLLYAPIDTLTTGDPSHDVPWIGPELRPDMCAEAAVGDEYVIGLGAGNPKGHAACILAVLEAIRLSGIELRGDVLAGFGAGGMPTNGPRSYTQGRRHIGQGVGCSFMLEQGVWADYAVIAKPGWVVSWEEVGLAWFDVWVRGTHTYVGSRHKLPYSNAIADAGGVAGALEAWFADYAAAHTTGTVSPQGVVSAVEGGWMGLAALTPAVCHLRVDLRLSPRQSPMDAKREFGSAIQRIRQERPSLDIEWDCALAIPGSSTSRDSWIVGSAIRAWEALEGSPHQEDRGMSGASDANILRNRGIPTVRIGMPKVAEANFKMDFQLGMNIVSIREMEVLARHLVHVTIDTCTRTRRGVGIDGE